jgi:hypothetical protein
MAETAAVRRIVHIRVRIPGTDVAAMLTLIRAGIPFYQASAKARVQLLKNADDPAQFVQIIEYESDAGAEASRQKIASDPMIQAYLQIWRTLSMAAVEVDVYEDVTEPASPA